MVPRGEVGLIFASVGQKAGILPPELYAQVILIVLGTTLITPPWLKSVFGSGARVRRSGRRRRDGRASDQSSVTSDQ
ncbi:MAG TPA: hypothetical protein VHS06_08155 [Chloroflexota bacterium]|nr:hypothetical protein [Chloroflexota bacterium]